MTHQKGIHYPNIKKDDKVKDDYFGTLISDPYRWLEDINSEKVKDFVKKQNQLTDKYLQRANVNGGGDKSADGGANVQEHIRARLEDLWTFSDYNCPFKRGNNYFYFKDGGLYMLESFDDDIDHGEGNEGQLILDNETINNNASSSNGYIALSLSSKEKTDENFGDPLVSVSNNGTMLAYGLSENGSRWTEIHFKNLTTEEKYAEVLQNVRQDSYLAWTKHGEGLFYSVYPKKATNYQDSKIFYHRLGTPQTEDKLILEFSYNLNWELKSKVSHCGEYLITYVLQDCGGHTKVYLCKMKDIMKYINEPGNTRLPPEHRAIVKDFQWDYDYITNVGHTFYFMTNKNAPNLKIVAVHVSTLDKISKKSWSDIVKHQKRNVLDMAICVHKDYLVTCYIQHVHSVLQLRKLRNGDLLYNFPLEIGAITGLCGRPQNRQFFFKFSSFLSPGTIYRVNLDEVEIENKDVLENDEDDGQKCCGLCPRKTPELTSIKAKVCRDSIPKGFDPGQYEVSQVVYTSKDRTKVNMYLVHKKQLVKNGQNPCLLYGYGGFNAILQPNFDPTYILFMEHFDGIYAVANIRGGGEFGNRWYQDGIRFKKQNSLNDFQYAARYLIRSKYTCPAKLAIRGNSNGGMIVAASINQRPELFGAAVVGFGVMDLLRFHKFSSGSCWISDYGSPENKKEFKNLLKISPYHNVHENDHAQYPAMLLITAENDEVVLPLHSYKMIAQLQSKIGLSAKQQNPLLLRIEKTAGHGDGGMAFETMIDETTDILSFLRISLGLEFKEK